MIPRVQSAVDVKKAIDSASSKLIEIGFDTSVLEKGYRELKERFPWPSSDEDDEDTLVVPGGGIIDNTQMVRRLSDYRVLNV